MPCRLRAEQDIARVRGMAVGDSYQHIFEGDARPYRVTRTEAYWQYDQGTYRDIFTLRQIEQWINNPDCHERINWP